MAEKIKLLELDIDVNQLVKNTTDARTSVEKLKEELKLLKKEPAENAKEITILNAQLKNASTQLRENELVLAKYTDTQNINNLTIKEARNQLAAISVLWSNEAKLNGENTEAAKKYAEAKLLLTERIKSEEAATGDNRRNVGNYTQSILEAGKSMGIFGGTFGNIIGSLQGMQGSLVAIRGGLTAASGGATGFAGAMNVVKVAIASTGIGLLVIAIGLLVTWLSKIDPVVDKTQQVFAAFGAAIDVVKTTILKFVDGIKSVGDLMSKLGTIIANPIDSFKQLAGSMAVAALEAAKLKEQQQELADAMQVQEVMTAKANQQVRELILQSKNRSLSEKERQALLAEAARIDQQDFERKSKLVEEDLRINTVAIAVKAQLNKQEISALKQKGVEYAIELLNQGKITQEDVDAYKKAQLSKIEILDETTVRQEKIQNQSDALEEKRIAKAEAYRKKLEEDEKKREESLKKKNELIIKEMEQQLRLQQALSERNKVDIVNDDTFQKEELRLANAFIAEKELLDKKYETEKNLSKGSKEELLEIETRHKADLAELNNKYNDITEANLKTLSEKAIKNAEDELTVFKLQHESRIKDGQLLTDELIQQEIERLTEIKDAAEEIERQRFLSGQITAEEFRAYQLEAEKGFLDTQQGLYNEKTQQLKDAKAIDAANDLAILELNGASKYDVEIAQLERSYQSEIAAAEKSGADKNKIYRKYELAKAAIAKEVQRAQLGSLADGLGQISELLGKNTAAGKAAGIAQATINTYLGVSQVLAAPPSGPEPLNTITKAIAIATTIGTGIANVANIVKVPTKFESGGKAATAGGNRHSSGGTKYYGDDGNVVELEQGENWYVLNRNASSAIGRLSDINQRYGGVSFHTANNSGFYEEGGLVGDGGLLQRSLTGGDIAGVVLQAVDTAFRNVTIVTKVTDVISETGKYNSLVDGANI